MTQKNGDGVVILEGCRTPFVKAWRDFRTLSAVDLGRIAVTELLYRTETRPDEIDEVIFGNVAQPPEATNIARVIALESGIPQSRPAHTVQRNCASGMESIVEAIGRVRSGEVELVVAGGVESMSQIPFLYPRAFSDNVIDFRRARGFGAKLRALLRFRPRHLLRPVIGLEVGLTDKVSGLNMGETAEVLAKEFHVSREDQDRFALRSHQRATAAASKGRLDDEVVPVPVPPAYRHTVERDIGPRENQSMEALSRLSAVFDRKTGTVTAGNSSQITDGAVACLIASADRARLAGGEPLGWVRSSAFVGVDPRRMGIGPAYAAPLALDRAGIRMSDIGLVEINEAFAAQVLACLQAFGSAKFAKAELGRDAAIGEIDPGILNVNGGAIALGHPVGASGARLAVTLLKEMARRDLRYGLAALCVGGGQGGALVLERAV